MTTQEHSHVSVRATGSEQHGARLRALRIALGANLALLVVQVVAGFAFGSLAVLADAAHLLADVVALGLALLAQQLTTRAPSARNTYGMLRGEVLAAQANAAALVLISVWVCYEAVQRLNQPEHVNGLGVLLIGLLALAVNGGSALVLAPSAGSSLNMRGALLHLVSDALGSLGVVAAGVLLLATGADWPDPVASILISVLVVAAAFGLLRDATRVLLEGVPKGLDVDAVDHALTSAEGVDAVHHVHVWSLGSETPALSAHVVLGGALTLHQAQEAGDRLKKLLAERFGIDHATLELECHACDDDVHATRDGEAS